MAFRNRDMAFISIFYNFLISYNFLVFMFIPPIFVPIHDHTANIKRSNMLMIQGLPKGATEQQGLRRNRNRTYYIDDCQGKEI